VRTSETPEPEESLSESRVAHRPSKTILPTAPLPDHIARNIETIVALQTRNEQDVPRHLRFVEAVTAFFGRPAFMYSILLVIVFWMLLNVLPRRFGVRQFDTPPFAWLELSLSIGAFMMTTGVLITQNRQEKLAEQRAQLSLQLNMLSEQKIAKLIALVEELRSDLPDVLDRHDPEAEMMKQAADPQVVMNTLEETLAEEVVELQKQETLAKEK